MELSLLRLSRTICIPSSKLCNSLVWHFDLRCQSSESRTRESYEGGGVVGDLFARGATVTFTWAFFEAQKWWHNALIMLLLDTAALLLLLLSSSSASSASLASEL